MMTGKHDKERSNRDYEQVAGAHRELPPDEPAEEIDHAVLSRARRHLDGKAVRPWNFGWIHAVTTAAIVVLGVALVLHVPDEEPVAPLRVAKPPSGKLRDPAAEVEVLRRPAPPEDAAGFTPTLRRAIPRPAAEKSEALDAVDAASETRSEETPGAGRSVANDMTAPAAEPLSDLDAAKARAAETAPVEAEETTEEMDPAQWIERLLALKDAGSTQELQQELAAFKAAWPDHPLPPELAN